MNKHQVKNIIYDLNPINCLSKFQNLSLKYVFLITGIVYGITIVIVILKIDLPYVSFHKDALFEIPQTMFDSTILIPILEETLFFGIPINLVNNPIIILVVGTLWSVVHLFVPLTGETYSLSLNHFIATLPILFIHFKLWKSGLGWISIIFHCVYNTSVEFLRCSQYITPCPQFHENNFEFPGFYIVLGFTIMALVITYFLQRRKEEKEYVEKILREK
ncbi:MAG: hypothetical protein IIC67_11195 [Thaumarchaeota archaeon]|nr:hypothetical protein [Nitrososphaerota archaeon]